ncbi:dienelactone hydrolase family protein [Schaalia sp. Marseille-Q2122]|uniref:dienelactone hydrolase family protein n=1 Tax=Schaalia sp. Marseille-Q2122 TaxID=2736604 RepID=UPI00158C358F|nr:dienelactone hydrolase family protein [Schaalia sp. Marseille-Q2122]
MVASLSSRSSSHSSWRSARGIAALGAACALVLGACTSGGADTAGEPAEATQSEPEMMEIADGPHAPADRTLAERTVRASASGNETIVDIDLGNTTAGEYSAPKRGVIVLPKASDAPAPLVVISHLRAPNCADGSFAYPCASGVEEYRFDRGMTYLGEALAAQGYAVVIPDLGGVFIGADTTAPYDQNAMWKEVVGGLVDMVTDAGKARDVLGVTALPQVDASTVGMVAHSRSGMMVDSARELFGEEVLKSVFAYGPAYDTFELESISPASADVPYLAVVGELDSDVGPSANLWIGHYLPETREHPISVVQLPGLGHMFVNDAAAQAGTDDRIGCDVLACPDASEHQRVMLETAIDWLNATLRGEASSLPVRADQSLPATVAGLPARWLAHTPGTLASVDASEFVGASEGSAKVCVHADPMNPIQPENACPEPESGVVQSITEVNYLTDASATVEVAGARGMSVHVSPSGSHEPAASLTVELSLADGQRFTHTIPSSEAVLANRASADGNGIYHLGTIRIPLDEAVAAGVVTGVRVTSDGAPVELKGVDFWR